MCKVSAKNIELQCKWSSSNADVAKVIPMKLLEILTYVRMSTIMKKPNPLKLVKDNINYVCNLLVLGDAPKKMFH